MPAPRSPRSGTRTQDSVWGWAPALPLLLAPGTGRPSAPGCARAPQVFPIWLGLPEPHGSPAHLEMGLASGKTEMQAAHSRHFQPQTLVRRAFLRIKVCRSLAYPVPLPFGESRIRQSQKPALVPCPRRAESCSGRRGSARRHGQFSYCSHHVLTSSLGSASLHSTPRLGVPSSGLSGIQKPRNQIECKTGLTTQREGPRPLF